MEKGGWTKEKGMAGERRREKGRKRKEIFSGYIRAFRPQSPLSATMIDNCPGLQAWVRW